MIDTSLDFALDFLKAHPTWYIFPITRLEKLPPHINNNLVDASNDPKQIKMWHARWRGCNWGLALKKSNVVAVDVDSKPGKVGGKTLDDLLFEHGNLPPTLTVRSPSGGTHYYFNGKHIFALGKNGFGLDVDSPNYTLIPGCVVCSNIDSPYTILADKPVADAPTWFYEYLKERAEKVAASGNTGEPVVDLDKPAAVARMIAYLREGAPRSIQGQGGDQTMFQVIAVLKDEGISESKALELLVQFYNVPGKCVPLWSVNSGPDNDRLDVKIKNVFNYARENKAGSASAEFAFGAEDDKIEPAEVEALAAKWRVKLAEQTKAKAEKRRASMFKDVDPITGEPIVVAEVAIDPLTGEPYEPGDDPNSTPPAPKPTKPKTKKKADKGEPDGSASANDGTDDKPDTADDDAPKDKAEVKSWIYRNWVWVVGIERFVRIRDSRMWSRTQFDSRYNNLAKIASISAALFKGTGEIQRFDAACFRPGKDMMLAEEFNLWRPSSIIPEQGDTNLWDEHLNYLFQDINDRDHVLNWLAWVYQNQEQKPNHALLIVGKNTGTGKSIIARIMEKLIGKENTQRPKNSSLKGDFNGWALKCKLCIIEELMQIGRREVANELRDIITEPTIEVNIKNVPAQLVENYMAMMGISNHPDALPIDETDRRWLVVSTPVFRRDPEYYTRILSEVLDNPKALAAIAYQLKTRDLKGYNAMSAAPDTDAKREMIDLSRSEPENWLNENMGNPPLSHRMIAIQDVVDVMPGHMQKSARITTVVTNFVRDKMKAELMGQYTLNSGRRARLWALGNRGKMLESATPEKIAEMYDADRKGGVKGGKTNDELAAEDFGEE